MGRIKGKFAYMAPEQLLRGEMDHRADIFALGTTLYEALAGRRPFEAADEAASLAALLEDDVPALSSLRPDVPAELADVIGRALDKEPSGRPSGADEVARVLDRVASTMAEPSATLADLLARLFEVEKAEGERAVAELRAACTGAGARVPAEATRTVDSMATTIRPILTSRPRRGLIGAALGLVALLGVAGVLVLRPGAGPPQPASAPEPARPKPASSDAVPASTPRPEPPPVEQDPEVKAVTPPAASAPPLPRAKPPAERATGRPRKAAPASQVEPGLVKEYPF